MSKIKNLQATVKNQKAELTRKMKLPELKENQKKKLIERFNQNKIKKDFSHAQAICIIFCGMQV